MAGTRLRSTQLRTVHRRWWRSRRFCRGVLVLLSNDSSDAIDEAVRTALGDPEVVVAYVSCSCSRSLRRAFALPGNELRALMPVKAVVALTNERLLVFQKRRRSRSTRSGLDWVAPMASGRSYQVLQVPGWRGHELALLDATRRTSEGVNEHRTSKWWFDECPQGWFTLKLRGETVKFSYPERMRHWLRRVGGWCAITGFLLLFLVAWTLWLFALGGVLLAVAFGIAKSFPEPGETIERWQAALEHRLRPPGVEPPVRVAAPPAPSRSRVLGLRKRSLLILWAAWLGAAIALGSAYPKKLPTGWAAPLAIATLLLVGLTIARVIVGIRARGRPQP
jgi:hypothetical protein